MHLQICIYKYTYYKYTYNSLVRAPRDDEGHAYDEEAAMDGNGHPATENGGSNNNNNNDQEEHVQQSDDASWQQENVTAAV
jgi:hypothetical protein